MGGGHHHHSPEAAPRAEQDMATLKANQVPMAYRDTCAHLLVPLNKCRRQTFFNPDQCGHFRHIYEECEFIAWEQRVAKKSAQIAAAALKAKLEAAAAK